MKTFISTLFIGFASFVSFASDYSVIDDYVNQHKQAIKLPTGTAVAIVKGQDIVYQGYFGYSDIVNKTKVDENTVFYIASMTKPFYSLLTLMQEEQGKLDTAWSLAKIMPEVGFKPSIRADKVTIKDLLVHTSGIDNWPLIQATAYTGDYDNNRLDQIIADSYVNESAPLGSYRYTNVGYNILSHWMDQAFKETWQSKLANEIFMPLGMFHTSAKMSDINKNQWRYAQGYSVKSPDPATPLYLQKTDKSMHAAGGMISTVKDLSRFIIAQLNQGKVDNQQIIPADVIAKSHQIEASLGKNKQKGNYAWGWFNRELFGENIFEHRGGYAGANTYMSFMPEHNLGLIVLSNQDKWGGDLYWALEDIAYSIGLGKSEEEVLRLLEQHIQFSKKKADKFYANKSASSASMVTNLPSQYVGEFRHDTMGSITVTSLKNGVELSWGNLKSLLLESSNDTKMAVEFNPNRPQGILFLTGTDGNHYIEFNDYKFVKQ